MKSYKNLKTLSRDELGAKRDELHKELVKDRAQIAMGTMPKSPGKIKLAKKTIARITQILEVPAK
ncbi:50S ribosomal protein L29 [Candidatus Woesearchaeota archaeon]|nr:50S ribosomal protein L29 [Candidatus Woesearchaeota archaeon]